MGGRKGDHEADHGSEQYPHISYGHLYKGYPPPPPFYPPPCGCLPPPEGCPTHGYAPTAPQQPSLSPSTPSAPQLQIQPPSPKHVATDAPSAPPQKQRLSSKQVGTDAPSAPQQQNPHPIRVRVGPPSVGDHVFGALFGLCTGLIGYIVVVYC